MKKDHNLIINTRWCTRTTWFCWRMSTLKVSNIIFSAISLILPVSPVMKTKHFEGYDKTVNPSAASAFTTSAFRFFIWAWTCSPGFQSSSGLATHCCQHTLSAGQRLTGCKISTEQDTEEKQKNLDVGSLAGRSCPVCSSSRTTFTRWDQILNNCNNCIVLQISVNVSKHRYLFTQKN